MKCQFSHPKKTCDNDPWVIRYDKSIKCFRHLMAEEKGWEWVYAMEPFLPHIRLKG